MPNILALLLIVMKLARLSLVGIAVFSISIALLQQRSPFTAASASESAGLNDTKNGSVAINSTSSSSSLPDPSNCDAGDANTMDGLFFNANFTTIKKQLRSADTMNVQLASNSSDAQNSTHHLHQYSAVLQNLSSDNHSSLELEQNGRVVSEGTTPTHATDLTSTSMKDSVEEIDLKHSDGSSEEEEKEEEEDDDDDDVLAINRRKLSGRATPPPADGSIHTAAQRSVAKESVKIMDMAKERMVFINAEQLAGRRTPPPLSSGIHTAAWRSVARDQSVEAMAAVAQSSTSLMEEKQTAARFDLVEPEATDMAAAAHSSIPSGNDAAAPQK